jgi:hypothetical protein
VGAVSSGTRQQMTTAHTSGECGLQRKSNLVSNKSMVIHELSDLGQMTPLGSSIPVDRIRIQTLSPQDCGVQSKTWYESSSPARVAWPCESPYLMVVRPGGERKWRQAFLPLIMEMVPRSTWEAPLYYSELSNRPVGRFWPWRRVLQILEGKEELSSPGGPPGTWFQPGTCVKTGPGTFLSSSGSVASSLRKASLILNLPNRNEVVFLYHKRIQFVS